MSLSETAAHQELKRLAAAWAFVQGYGAVALEVRLPRSAFRADVAAYRKACGIGSTVVFECKQARSDFLKDSRSTELTRAQLAKLEARRITLERLLRVHEPSLRKGEELFAEYDALDTDRLRHPTYQRVIKGIVRLQNQLYGKTKFDRVARYRCANLNYIVTLPGVLDPAEVPLGWGLLVSGAAGLELARRPVWQDVEERFRLELLYRIAAAASRSLRPRIEPASDIE